MHVERLFKIVFLLMNGSCCTAKELAEQCSVSVRTIQRDLDALSLAGIPVYSNRGYRGGVGELKEFTLDKTFMTSRDECEKMLDGFGMTDEVQRNMYRAAMPRQFSMLYNAGCLILPFFKVREPLLQPSSLSSLNDFASIWCCIENILLAAASEGILGVPRIPMTEESEHIKTVVGHPEKYVMPCYIALGYPAQHAFRPAQKEIHAKERIHINSW